MSAIKRAVTGAKAIATNPVERRGYASRLRFLLQGTEGIQPWSLEHRSGLTGRFAVPAERHLPEPASTLWCPPGCGANSELGHLYERRFVYRMQKTIASTASGATLASCPAEPAFFVRESISWPFESVLAHGLEIPRTAQVEQRISQPAVVLPTTPNYYHWLIEDLPLALRAHDAAPEAAWLSYSEGITDRHRLVAAAMGASLREAPVVVALDQQVLPGRAADSFFPHPGDVERLRTLGQLLAARSAPGRTEYPERIYVSRRISRRPLEDEEGLENALRQQGFEVVYLERTPWLEQIRLFQNAKVVVAPHGAGLANLAFGEPGQVVVELTVGYMFNRCFEWLCHVAGHDYRPVEADSQPLSGSELAARAVGALER